MRPAQRQLHGRNKGKKLRPTQARLLQDLLPLISPAPGDAPVEPAALFAEPYSRLIVEIGFGGGEHVVDEARRHPKTAFLACEPFVNGVAKLLAVIDRDDLANIRIHMGDALALLMRLPAACADRVDLLFPDPWPKRRQRKRRFVSAETLAELARVIRPGGAFHFASDIDDYVGWTLSRVTATPHFVWTAGAPADWTAPWPDHTSTRYELKAQREGRVSSYLTFMRI